MKKILVIGSAVLDHVIRVPKFPRPGESVRATGFELFPGGKGANQAVAAARLGAETTFAGCLGTDSAGDQMLEILAKEGLNVSPVSRVDSAPTGAAFIQLSPEGQNMIAVDLGANLAVTPAIAESAAKSIPHDVLLLQAEIPLEAIEAAAFASPAPVVFNPAPALPAPLSRRFWERVYAVTPNEHEAAALLGTELEADMDLDSLSGPLANLGARHCIVTLGEAGCRWISGAGVQSFSAPRVKVIDTVGAGDCFNGALAVAIARGRPMAAAIDFAIRCASFSVQFRGAQAGLPRPSDVAE